MFPLAFAIVKEQLPARSVGFAMGLVASIGGVGGGVGLLLAGVVLDYLSWRWLFAIAAIIAAISAVIVHRVIRDAPGRLSTRLDVPGAILLMAGLATLMIGLTEGPELGWAAPVTLGLFAAALLLLVGWVIVERRVPDPLVDVRMLVRRTVLMTNLATLVAGFAMFATFVIVPVLVEAPRGLAEDVVAFVDYGFDGSSTLTGLLILPASLAIVVGGVFLGFLIRHIQPERLFGAALGVMTVGMAAIAAWHDTEWRVALAMIPFGLGIGVVLALGPPSDHGSGPRERDGGGNGDERHRPRDRLRHRRSGRGSDSRVNHHRSDRRAGRRCIHHCLLDERGCCVARSAHGGVDSSAAPSATWRNGLREPTRAISQLRG